MTTESFSHAGLFFQMGFNPKQDGLRELKIRPLKNSSIENHRGPSCALAQECRQQIVAYLEGRLQSFELPLELQGTAFQRRVWEKLSQIPYGVVTSYKELAQKVESPKAYRAVGSANGANPIPIIIPCHRVVSHKKGLGGYALGLEMKKYFLELEGVQL